MMRVLALLLLVMLPASARAHTTEMLGGRLVQARDGRVELRLEVSAHRLPLFVGELPDAFKTWRDVRELAPDLTTCFQQSLFVFANGQEQTAAEVFLPGLADAKDTDALPDFVSVVLVWQGLSSLPGSVIPRFDLGEIYVMLLLDDNLGGGPAPDEREAVSETEAPASEAAGSWWRMISRAVLVGYEHIVPLGLDHILFVLGLFFAVRNLRDLVAQVTMFTVAHSITLGLAMAGVVALGATWARLVEIGIAVSIVAVAVENCVIQKSPGPRRLAIVGVFGLIHGLGFAGALSAVKWPADQFVPALIAANVGIELGQLTVVGAAALLTAWAWKREWYRRAISRPASVAIGLCGLYWAITRTAGAF